MLKRTLFCIVVSISMLSSLAHAQDNYFGGSVAFIDYSEGGLEDASLTAIFGRLGSDFNENFSGEIRAGVGIGDDSVDVFGNDVTVELDSMIGAYVRGGVRVSDMFFPYAVLGYTRGEITASLSSFGSASETESDVSFGLGADLNFNRDFALNIEYTNYYDKDGVEISGFSIGFVNSF